MAPSGQLPQIQPHLLISCQLQTYQYINPLMNIRALVISSSLNSATSQGQVIPHPNLNDGETWASEMAQKRHSPPSLTTWVWSPEPTWERRKLTLANVLAAMGLIDKCYRWGKMKMLIINIGRLDKAQIVSLLNWTSNWLLQHTPYQNPECFLFMPEVDKLIWTVMQRSKKLIIFKTVYKRSRLENSHFLALNLLPSYNIKDSVMQI